MGFTGDALAAVHRLSGGIPRVVNLVCDRALLAGFVKGSRTVTAAMVRQAGAEVEARGPAPPSAGTTASSRPASPWPSPLLAFSFAPRLARAPEAPAAGAPAPPEAAPSASPATPTPAPPPRSARLDEILRTVPAGRVLRERGGAGGGGLGPGRRSRARPCARTSTSCAPSTSPRCSRCSTPRAGTPASWPSCASTERAAVVAGGDAPGDRGAPLPGRRPLDAGRGRLVAGDPARWPATAPAARPGRDRPSPASATRSRTSPRR